MTTDPTRTASPMGEHSHYEIEIHRPEGWVELGTDQRRARRAFHDPEDVRRRLAVLEEDHFRTRTIAVDTAGKRLTCRI